ncbi:hypothetical protein ScPMuIL_004491 [Solemya velum]
MPHVNSSGSEDFFSTDEVKVYKDEGEEEKRSSENLSEDKLGLVTETEEGKNSSLGGNYSGNEKTSSGQADDGKSPSQNQGDRNVPFGGYVVPPYPYPNGASVQGGKMSMVQSPLGGLMMYNNEHFAQPPPAHMGIPPVHIDPKTGLPRPPMYAYPPPGQFPTSLYGPEFPQVQWQRPPGYPISSGAFSGPYPTSLINSSALSRLGPPGFFHPSGIPPPGMPHPGMLNHPGPKQEPGVSQPLSQDNHSGQGNMNQESEKKKPHIKKPLNAFMLFMKEQRASVVAECTLKESAAINQILGRKWHALDKSDQAKYYEMAKKEKELHLQLYPGWSARDNYACQSKKKRKRKEIHGDNRDCTIAKKCRARFGVDQQMQWCKPCRRKKKCIKFLGDDDGTGTDGEDGYSDSMPTGDSVHDSDSILGSPSVHSEDAYPSRVVDSDDNNHVTSCESFCRNSPSPQERRTPDSSPSYKRRALEPKTPEYCDSGDSQKFKLTTTETKIISTPVPCTGVQVT